MDKIEINLNEKVNDETSTNPVEVINLDFFMKTSRTLTELVESFVELEQNNDQMCLYCVVCNPPDANIGTAASPRPGVFFYKEDLEQDFENNTLPRNFRNLKKSIKKHFSTVGHNLCVKSAEQLFEENQKFISKTADAGMRCGRWLYLIFFKGRPYYPELFATDMRNGAFCGNINYSEKFPSALLPHIAEAIKNRKIHFLSIPFVQTGFRAPIKTRTQVSTGVDS